MSKSMAIAVVVALAGCAGVQAAGQQDVSGHWVGAIDRGGQREPVAIDIERDGGSYRGQLRPVSDPPADPAALRRDEVRFETEGLRFVGRVDGGTLSGTVTDKREGVPVGQLSAVQTGSEQPYSPGSEWSIPTADF
ncbi:MAG TPA: hypothetical protein VI356_10290 [Myxococcales bacterium]